MFSAILEQAWIAFGSPTGLFVVAAVLTASAGVVTWAFWEDGRPRFRSRNQMPKHDAPNVEPPQLLVPELSDPETTFETPKDTWLRNGSLMFLGFSGFIACILAVVAYIGQRPAADESVVASSSVSVPERSLVKLDRDNSVSSFETQKYLNLICKEGQIDRRLDGAYQLCATSQAARFDVIKLSRHGRIMDDAVWKSGAENIVTSLSQSTPFPLDTRVKMHAGIGLNIEDYDAFLAIGVAEKETDADKAVVEAVGRSNAIGRFVLNSFRGVDEIDGIDEEYNCNTNGNVVAITVGQSESTKQTKPVLVGIKFDERFPVGQRDLRQLINEFVTSNGVEEITGFSPDVAASYDDVFAQTICRLPA